MLVLEVILKDEKKSLDKIRAQISFKHRRDPSLFGFTCIVSYPFGTEKLTVKGD